MSDSFVQVPPDSSGKQIATNQVGGKQYQIVNLADVAGNMVDNVNPLQVYIAGGSMTSIAVFDDNTLNATVYPMWVTGAGVESPKISTTKVSFTPLTGKLEATTITATTITATTNSVAGATSAFIFDGRGRIYSSATDKIEFRNSTNSGDADITAKNATADQFTFSPAPVTLNANGTVVTLTAGEALTFGQVCYFKSDAKLWRANGTTVATAPVVAMALGTIAANASGSFLILGAATLSTWTWTVGGVIYLADTVGNMTQTPPVGVDKVVQVLGIALSATTIMFNPSRDYITRTA